MMSTDQNSQGESTPIKEPMIEAECPKCGHKFWHKIGDGLKKALDDLGNAIGEAKFGG